MTSVAEIGWGKYINYEGPYFRGKQRFAAPVNPDFLDKCLLTLTATEGGTYDAVNMYDRCILSVGLIQWCEAFPQCSTSTLLGYCAAADSFLFESKLQKFPADVKFQKTAQGVWRFFHKGVEVASQNQQRALFYGNEKLGSVGSWQETDKGYAKEVAAWFANLWDVPLFRRIQAEFTKNRIPNFAMKEAKHALFADPSPKANESWQGALRAAFYSFAGNIPVVANNSIKRAEVDSAWASADWADRFRIGLQQLTFGPGITIYPGRYDKIAPVLKAHFGVGIPVSHEELRVWGDAPAEERVLTEEEKFITEAVNEVHKTIVAEVCELPFANTLWNCSCEDK